MCSIESWNRPGLVSPPPETVIVWVHSKVCRGSSNGDDVVPRKFGIDIQFGRVIVSFQTAHQTIYQNIFIFAAHIVNVCSINIYLKPFCNNRPKRLSFFYRQICAEIIPFCFPSVSPFLLQSVFSSYVSQILPYSRWCWMVELYFPMLNTQNTLLL